MCTSSYSILIPWIAISGVESLVIILGNVVTIIVFWKNRRQLKRTCYLLINLSLADLMVGVGNVINVANEIWQLTYSICATRWPWKDYIALDEFFGCASITFLVLISLERLYAIVWPFRIRATSTRSYICSIGVAWLISVMSIAAPLLLKESGKWKTKNVFTWFSSVYMLVCLITISCAYSVIWYFSKKEDPRLPLNRHNGNKELAKTLFIVTLLSVITWLPLTVVYSLRPTLEGDTGSIIFLGARFLQLSNSFINPIVYCFRMPLFRTTLRTMFLKKTTRRLHVHVREQHVLKNNAAVLLAISTLTFDNIKHR